MGPPPLFPQPPLITVAAEIAAVDKTFVCVVERVGAASGVITWTFESSGNDAIGWDVTYKTVWPVCAASHDCDKYNKLDIATNNNFNFIFTPKISKIRKTTNEHDFWCWSSLLQLVSSHHLTIFKWQSKCI